MTFQGCSIILSVEQCTCQSRNLRCDGPGCAVLIMDLNTIKRFQKIISQGEKKLYLVLSAEEARGMGWGVSGMVQAVEIIIDVEDETITGGVINFGEQDDFSLYGNDYLDAEDAEETVNFIESGAG